MFPTPKRKHGNRSACFLLISIPLLSCTFCSLHHFHMEKWYESRRSLTLHRRHAQARPSVIYTKLHENLAVNTNVINPKFERGILHYKRGCLETCSICWDVARNPLIYAKIIRLRNALICHINLPVKLCSRQASRELWKFRVPSDRLFTQSTQLYETCHWREFRCCIHYY